MVPGDLPPRLFYAASAGLAAPAASIMNRIAQTGEWPSQYQTEWGVPLEKSKRGSGRESNSFDFMHKQNDYCARKASGKVAYGICRTPTRPRPVWWNKGKFHIPLHD